MTMRLTVKPRPLRPSTRAWKPGALLDAVRALILELRDGDPDSYTSGYVKAETIAVKLRAKKSMVTTAFQRLIEEGILGHKTGPKKHDKRTHDREARGPNTAHKYREIWYPSTYTILPKEKPRVPR